ncbi:MAG: hypothetical protein LKM33_03440 [Bacteroidales bacterium]|jgi:hypothetical protein|nr:hypothetical protein [Bacteroidales bacterium]
MRDFPENKIFLSFFLLIIVVGNGLLNYSLSNLCITIPQIIIVFFFIARNDISSATFWHFIFIILSYTYYDLGGLHEGEELISYNYAKLRVLSIPISFVVSCIILLICYSKNDKNYVTRKDTDFYHLFLMIKTFLFLGVGFGLFGLALGKYYIKGFIQYGSYGLILFINALILLKLFNSDLKDRFYDIIPLLLSICLLVKFVFIFSASEISDSTSFVYYSVLFLPLVFYVRRYVWPICFFALYVIMQAYVSSGKEIIDIIIILVCVIILSFNKKISKIFPTRCAFVRGIIFVFFIISPIVLVVLTNLSSSATNLSYKIHQVQTLFAFSSQKISLLSVDGSPYIRIASIANILHEGLINPLFLLFGHGYGGYYTDSLTLLSNINLNLSAFAEDAIVSGHFYTGHDTIVVVPFLHGLFGFGYILYVAFLFLKKASENYLKFAAIPFLLLVFYFDTLLGISGLVLLYASEHKVRNLV